MITGSVKAEYNGTKHASVIRPYVSEIWVMRNF